jgi:HAD superfamily hydrolase (TIGR01509 family)
MIKVIGFDLDNTLWPVKPAIMYAEGQLKDYLAALSPAIDYPPQDIQFLRATVLAENPDYSYRLTDLRRAILHTLVQRNPAHRNKAQGIADRAMEVFLKARNHVTLYPGADAALRALARTYALCTLTNGNADVGQLPIGNLFQLKLSAEDVGAPKPNPALFLAALEQFQCQPDEMIYVGDDPVLDVDAASKLGIYTIWKATDETFAAAEATNASETIVDLTALPDAIARINTRISTERE